MSWLKGFSTSPARTPYLLLLPEELIQRVRAWFESQ